MHRYGKIALDPKGLQNEGLHNSCHTSTVVEQYFDNYGVVKGCRMLATEFAGDGATGRSNPVVERAARILHIEDDPALAEMYAMGLEIHGFEVLRAANGLAGVEAAAANVPDFLVIDINLPLLDGIQVLERLRNDPRTAGIPAVLLTAYNPRDYVEQAAALGVDQVLSKSATTPSELALTIQQWFIRAA
jgi:CheY-like chemotaxis protein